MEVVSVPLSSDAPLEIERKYDNLNSPLESNTQIVPLILWGNTFSFSDKSVWGQCLGIVPESKALQGRVTWDGKQVWVLSMSLDHGVNVFLNLMWMCCGITDFSYGMGRVCGQLPVSEWMLHKTPLICTLSVKRRARRWSIIGSCSCRDACVVTGWNTAALGLATLTALMTTLSASVLSSTVAGGVVSGEAIARHCITY